LLARVSRVFCTNKGDASDLFTLVDRKAKIYTKRSSSLQFKLDLVSSHYPVERQFDDGYKMAGGKAGNPLGSKSREGFLGRYV
jgi:hypothetical protein